MESNSGDRQSESPADPGSPEQQGLTGADQQEPGPGDIFDQIARNIFVTRGYPISKAWITVIAEEYRTAMAQLRVEVKPEGPAPDPHRTRNGTIMLLFGALENGDLWVQDTEIPLTKREDGTFTLASSLIAFVCGLMRVEAQFAYNLNERRMTFQRFVSVTLGSGQKLSTDHKRLRWLQAYTPPMHLDVFSPALQKGLDKLPEGSPRWEVIGIDEEGRQYKFPGGGAPVLWKDARGREL